MREVAGIGWIEVSLPTFEIRVELRLLHSKGLRKHSSIMCYAIWEAAT